MSRGKKFVAVTLMTFIALIVVGALWGHHAPADPTGPAFNSLGNYPKTTTNVPVSQDGLNALASDTAHLGVSINFTWTLITGFLVLFMQVGFAFLVTGLTRAKNAGHMMMMNIAAFAVALLAYYAVGFAFQFGGSRTDRQSRRRVAVDRHLRSRQRGRHRTHGFFLQSDGAYDVGVMVLFLFEVVFMETAGYIIIGAIAERDLVRRRSSGRDRDGRDHLPDLRHVDVGRRLAGPARHVAAPRTRRRRLRRVRCRPCDRRVGGPRRWRWCSVLASASSTRTARRTRIPGHNIPFVVDRHARPRVRLDGLQPGFDARRDRPAHRSRRGEHACSPRASAS